MSKETKNKMMTEERFFSKVKDTFQGYAPEVPQSVYAGMRRKLWMSNFMRFDATRFNMWYLLIAAAGITTASLTLSDGNAIAQKANSSTVEMNIIAPVNAESATPSACCAMQNKTECASLCTVKADCVSAKSNIAENATQGEPDHAANNSVTPPIPVNLSEPEPKTDDVASVQSTTLPQLPEVKKGFDGIAEKDKVIKKIPKLKK